ncbi:MAG: putative damage-inducible protein DinB [Phycisphaerales bacterium]|jgi:uncharacterized damage-inducible protein DinB
MAQSDPPEIMIRHDEWSMGLLFDECAKLTDEQLDQEFEMGPGTLRMTITHILAAMRGWGDMLAGREQRDRLETMDPFSVARWREMHKELAADFANSVRSHPADEVVTAERGGKSYAFTRGQVLTHVMTHGVHHRAQALNMLRHLGANGETPSSVMEWSLMVDPAG